MKTGLKTIFTFSLLTAYIFIGCTNTDIDRAELAKTLDQIAQYQPGMSLEPMIRLDSLLRTMQDPGSRQIIEQEIITRLQSDITLSGKQQFCRRLHLIGSGHSVPVLLKMLNDTLMFDMALYALEMIPAKQIDETLAVMLKTSKGARLVATINMSGTRVVESVIPDLANLMQDPQPDISAAAVNALLKMPAEKTIGIFLDNKTSPPAHLRDRLFESLLITAGKLQDQTRSSEILTKFYEGNYPAHFRINALHGVVKIDQDRGAELILRAVKGDQPDLRAGALAMTDILPESEMLSEIVSYADNLSEYEQVLLIEALGHRQENKFPGTLQKFAGSKYPSVRHAALKNLAQTGNPDMVMFLADCAAKSVGEEKNTARESLYLLFGSGVDEKIVESIPTANKDTQYELIRSAGERMIPGCSKILMICAADPDQSIRKVALQSLRQVAGTEDFTGMLDLLVRNANGEEEKLLMACLDDVMARMIDSKNKSEEILLQLGLVTDPHKKGVLLELLGTTGAAKALPLLTEAAETGDESLQEHAIRGLSRWPDETPYPLLADLIIQGKSKKNRILAFRGYLSLLTAANHLSADSLSALFSKAFELAPDPAEKKRVFSAITSSPGFSALDLILPYVNDPQFKTEAETAIIMISWQIIDVDNNLLRPIIQQVLAGTESQTIKEQSQNLLREIE